MPRYPASTTNSIHQRLKSLSSQLQAPEPSHISTMATQVRDPITCHVLDTTTGRPAANMSVKLSCCSLTSVVFEASTNADGRIANWQNKQGTDGQEGEYVKQKGGVANTLQSLIQEYAERNGAPSCKIKLFPCINLDDPLLCLRNLVYQGEIKADCFQVQ